MQVVRAVRIISVVVVIAAGLWFGRAEAADGRTAEIGRALGRPVLLVDGDAVVLGSDDETVVAAKGSGSSTGSPVYRDGFATFGDAVLLPAYEIRLVASPRIEQVRPHVAAARTDAATVGPALSLRDGVIERMGPGRGQIDVTVSSSSPCRGYWLACGGPTIVDGVVHSGQIWVNPRLLERAHSEILNTVRHEFGHTMGLAHFDGWHRGELQVMHSRRFDATNYRAGDRSGIAFTTSGGRPGVTIDQLRYAAGRVIVGGALHRVPPGASLRIDTGRTAVRRAIAGDRYRNAVRSPGGRLQVCVAVEYQMLLPGRACGDLDAPTQPFGQLESVVSGAVSVQVSGWAIDPQTADPIRVDLVIDRGVQPAIADRRRPDVAAAHPDYGERHGFRISRYVVPGVHEVCVVARDTDGGRDRGLGCHTVRVGGSAAGL